MKNLINFYTIKYCIFSIGVFVCFSANSDCNINASWIAAQDDLVIDTKNNLAWQMCSVGQTWNSSTGCEGEAEKLSYVDVENMLLQTSSQWRLPTTVELLSLMDITCGTPTINQILFPITEAGWYWAHGNTRDNYISYISFADGGVAYGFNEQFKFSLRLVKSLSSMELK